MSDVIEDCWEVLGVAPGADERSIRRQYARLLKVHRPDEDPEAFQRVREAYEQALAQTRWELDEPHAEAQALPQQDAPAPVAQSIEPLIEAAPDQVQQARALLDGLDPAQLDSRWQQARAQGCEAAFEYQLLQYCLSDAAPRLAILHWAVPARGWFTPWQAVPMTAYQADELLGSLWQACHAGLQVRLEAGDERSVYTCLEQWGGQAWLEPFDRREQLQAMLLQLLHEHDTWSHGLFERICQYFNWSDDNGGPKPSYLWQALNERCERDAWFARQQALAEQWHWHTQPEGNAAYLLLRPLALKQQVALAQGFSEADWNACEHLTQTLLYRYPELLDQVPHRDLYFWRKLAPRPMHPRSYLRVMSTMLVVILLWMAGPKFFDNLQNVLIAAVVGGLLTVQLSSVFMRVWQWLSSSLLALDLRLSGWLIPQWANPDGERLLLRHGVPRVMLALPIYPMLAGTHPLVAVVGLVGYFGVGLLGLLPYNPPTGEGSGPLHKAWRVLHELYEFNLAQVVALLVTVVVVAWWQVQPPGFLS